MSILYTKQKELTITKKEVYTKYTHQSIKKEKLFYTRNTDNEVK